jgi:hypothetical protein
MKPKNITINSVDDFIDEIKMMPDLNRRLVFNLDPVDEYFMGVAEKHGVFDNINEEDNI